MAKLVCESYEVIPIADELRNLYAIDDEMSLAEMRLKVADAVADVQEQAQLISQIVGALDADRNVSIESSIKNNTQLLKNCLEVAEDVTSIELPTLTNAGVASDLRSGKQLIDQDGNIVTGNVQTVTQATPSISVDANGLVTATATQSAGFVDANTKTATKQLTTQGAKTVTPSTSEQTVVASGMYTTGAVKVGAIPSKYVDNSAADALQDHVLSGKKYGSTSEVKTGTMPNNGAIASTMDGIGTKSVVIPAGYTSGGSVSLDNTIDTEVEAQAVLIDQILGAVNSLPEQGGSVGEISLILSDGTAISLDELTNLGCSFGAISQIKVGDEIHWEYELLKDAEQLLPLTTYSFTWEPEHEWGYTESAVLLNRAISANENVIVVINGETYEGTVYTYTSSNSKIWTDWTAIGSDLSLSSAAEGYSCSRFYLQSPDNYGSTVTLEVYCIH